MTTPHIGDEDELVTADHADDETEQPEQAAQAENTAPPDPADEAEPDEVEQDKFPREMERSLPAPTAFNIEATDLNSEWKHWSSAFEIYSIASDLQRKDDLQFREPRCCIALALQCTHFQHTPWRTQMSLEEAKTALNGYFAPKRNVVAERYKFRSRAQKAHGSFDAYLMSLRELVKSCDFGTLEEEIRDQIVEQCSSQTLKQKLLQQEDLDLAKTMRIARNAETAVQEAQLLSQRHQRKPDPDRPYARI